MPPLDLIPDATRRTPDTSGDLILAFRDGDQKLAQGMVQVGAQAQPIYPHPDRVTVEDQVQELFVSGVLDSMNVDGSVTPVEFATAVVPTGNRWLVGVRLVMRDAGNIDPVTGFGAGAELTNGLKLELLKSGAPPTSIEIVTAKANRDLAYIGGMFGFQRFQGATHGLVIVEFDFGRITMMPGALLVLEEGDSFRFTVQDNLTGLDQLKASLHGRRGSDG